MLNIRYVASFVLSPCFIYIPVYHEKFLTLGNTEAAPAQKAMTSVIDVIVIATPLVLILDVSARPDKRMNMSSTPIPKNSTSYYIICPCLIPFPIIIYKARIYTYIFQKRFFYYHFGLNWLWLTVDGKLL